MDDGNKQEIEINIFRFEIKKSCGPCDGKPSINISSSYPKTFAFYQKEDIKLKAR